MFDLVAKGLIGIVIAKGVKIGGRVKVRWEWGGEIEREVISVGVFGPQVPKLEMKCFFGVCDVLQKPPWRHVALYRVSCTVRIGWGPVVPGVCTVRRLVLTPTVTTLAPHAALCPTIKFLLVAEETRGLIRYL